MSRKESLNNDINNISKAIHLLLVSIFGISAWGFVNYESLESGKIILLFIVACLLCAAEYIIIKRYKKLNKELENLWVFWYLLLLFLFFFLVFFCWFLEYKKHKSLRFLLLVKYPRTSKKAAGGVVSVPLWLTAVSMIGVVLIGISVILLHRKIIKLQHELGELW